MAPAVTRLGALRLGIRGWMKAAGVRCELRRVGEWQVGLWRKRLRPSLGGDAAAGRRVLLVPGLGDSPISWVATLAPLVPLLARRHDEIVALDLPGYNGLLAEE